MPADILALIKQHGPVTVNSLQTLTGMEDKHVRSAIDTLRNRGEPIWKSVNGFWFSSAFKPLVASSGRWKREPERLVASKVLTQAIPQTRDAGIHRFDIPRFKTPILPNWIKELSCPPYVNIFELGLNNRNLFGTETLLGDWAGPLLIIAKDFAPADEVRAVAAKVPDAAMAYRHNDGDGRYRSGLKTNRQLVKFVFGSGDASMIDGRRSLDCGALYMSACFFLKPGGSTSSPLNGWKQGTAAFVQSWRVFSFVLQHMPRLRGIACLGVDAALLVRSALPHDSRVKVGNLPHPSRPSREGIATDEAAWGAFFRDAGIKSVGGTVRVT